MKPMTIGRALMLRFVRLVSVADVRRPALIFREGACEGVDFEEVSSGALLVAFHTRIANVFRPQSAS